MEPFIAQIMMFAGTFAPRGWAFCDGLLLPISQNPALFSLLGTTYGGDGRTTFALPDLRGRVPMHAGNGPGLTPRRIGTSLGAESVGLNIEDLPAHSHDLIAVNAPADSDRPSGKMLARSTAYAEPSATTATLSSTSLTNTGTGAQHSNMQPSLCITYIIALQGIFPSRS